MMRWLLNTRETEDVTIVEVVSASISPAENYGNLKETLDDLLAQGRKKILVDLTNVQYADSSGIRDLIVSYSSAENRAAKLKLMKPQKIFYDLLVITRLNRVIEIFFEEEEALESFRDTSAGTRRSAGSFCRLV